MYRTNTCMHNSKQSCCWGHNSILSSDDLFKQKSQKALNRDDSIVWACLTMHGAGQFKKWWARNSISPCFHQTLNTEMFFFSNKLLIILILTYECIDQLHMLINQFMKIWCMVLINIWRCWASIQTLSSAVTIVTLLHTPTTYIYVIYFVLL